MKIFASSRGRLGACGFGAALLVAALLAGCGGAGTPSAAQIIAQSEAKTAALKSFHVVVSVEHVPTPATGMSIKFLEGDLVVPDRLHAHLSGTLNGVPLTTELIAVGAKHFLKDPFSGAWRTVDLATTPMAFFDPAKGVLAVIRGAAGATMSGSEDVGGVPSYRIAATVRADALTPLLGNPATSARLPVQLWIGKRDKLLRRISLAGATTAKENATAVRTVELSAFGESVRIVVPAPA
jgi:lipoprotein LprG